jgi:hypothetical protein
MQPRTSENVSVMASHFYPKGRSRRYGRGTETRPFLRPGTGEAVFQSAPCM